MRKSDSIVKLSGALLKVQKEMEPVAKEASNPYYKSKYADINAFLDATLEILNKNGILMLQPHTHNDGKNFVETLLIHTESGEFMSGETEVICAKPNDPQALGSAITYSRRYGVQSFLSLRAEDDDGNAGSGKTYAAPSKPTSPTLTKLAETKKEEIKVIASPSTLNAASKAANSDLKMPQPTKVTPVNTKVDVAKSVVAPEKAAGVNPVKKQTTWS